MKIRIIGNVLLATLAVIIVVFATTWIRRCLATAAENESACAELSQQNATLRAKILEAEKEQAGIGTAAMSPVQTNDARRAEREERLRRSRERSQEQAKSFNEKLETNREVALKYYATKRARVDLQYGLLLYSLRVMPQQRNALAEALFVRELRLDSMLRRLRAGELSYDEKSVQKKIREEAQIEFREAIANIVDDSVVGKFDRYERARPAWDYANEVAAELAFGPTPLSIEQAVSVASAIADGSETYRKGGVVVPKEMDWARVDAKVRAILSPDQFEFFTSAQITVAMADWGMKTRQGDELQQALEKLRK